MKKRLIVILLALSLVGCASKTESKVIKVGTEGAYPPFNYVNTDGTVDGYDIAVVKAIDELIDDVEFEFVPTAWDGIFVALDAGQFDLIASNLGKNKDREAKYLFSDEAYTYGGTQIIFKSGRQDITSFADLKGKKVAAGVGTASTTKLEEYNAANGNEIEIVYTDGNINNALLEIDAGRVDATLGSIITTNLTAKELGISISGVQPPELSINGIYLLYAKTEENQELKTKVDAAIKTLKENGKLKELSIKYFGADYSSEEAAKAVKQD